MQVKSVPTHEIKYVLNNIKSHQVIQWLKTCFAPDSEFPEGTVSSIYYDTRDWLFMGEKINSDYLKTKVRVRWYSDLSGQDPSQAAFVEAKFKIGGKREKIHVKAPASGGWLSDVALEDEELNRLPLVLNSHGFAWKGSLLPVFQITYRRLRFIEPVSGSRICIDYDISAPRVNHQMVPRANPFCLRNAVFEIKGALRDLPSSLHTLVMLGGRKAAFSKYSTCYQKIMRTQ